MANQLVVDNISKHIQTRQILNRITFTAETGDLLVITGHNGAGKTTLLNIIAGLMPQSSGKVLWNLKELNLDHGSIGYLSHKTMLYEDMSVYDNLKFFARLYGCYLPIRLEKALKEVGLWLRRLDRVAILSRGMQQRLAIARTLIHQPQLILYDEPFTGLDVEGQDLLRSIISANRQKTVQLLITHELEMMEKFDYREIKLKNGKVIEGVSSV